MDINKYKQQGYSTWRLEEIKQAYRDGLSAEVIDEWIVKPYYGADQMYEIRLGLLAGIDVSTYAKEGIPSEEMQHIREKLLIQKEEADNEALKEEKEQKQLETSERRAKVSLSFVKSALIFVPILVTLFLLGVVIFYGSEFISLLSDDLYINLTTDTVTLEVGETFDAESYILGYTDSDGVIIDLPSVDTSEIGTYQAEYLISNEYRTKRATLTVNVVDTIAPTLSLTTDTVTITQGDSFACATYYEVSDNYDNNVAVSCSTLDDTVGEHEITITATDSSGNTTETTLVVTVEEKEATSSSSSSASSSSSSSLNSTSSSSSSSSSSNSTSSSSSSSSGSSSSNSSNSAGNTQSGTNSTTTDSSDEPYISGTLNYSVPVGTSTDEFIYLVSSSITASSTITITFSSVNLGVAGTYAFTISGADGATATGTVTVY